MSIRKCTPTRGPRSCRPKAGITWCLQDRHADGKTVHKHFRQRAGAERASIELAAERLGGPRVPGRTARVTFADYAERCREAWDHASPETVAYALARALPEL